MINPTPKSSTILQISLSLFHFAKWVSYLLQYEMSHTKLKAAWELKALAALI